MATHELGDEWEQVPSQRRGTFLLRKNQALIEAVRKRRRFLGVGEIISIMKSGG